MVIPYYLIKTYCQTFQVRYNRSVGVIECGVTYTQIGAKHEKIRHAI